jgi:hypothetical protein
MKELIRTLTVIPTPNQEVFFISEEGIKKGTLWSYAFSFEYYVEQPEINFCMVQTEDEDLFEVDYKNVFKTEEDAIASNNFEECVFTPLETKKVKFIHLPLLNDVIFETGFIDTDDKKIISQGKIVQVNFLIADSISVSYTIQNPIIDEENEVCHTEIIDSI